MRRLLELVRTLRGPGGCAWDREQTYQSFRYCLVEEAREAVLAIERGDFQNLKEELGDTLFNLCFLVNLAEEDGHFTLDEVIEGSREHRSGGQGRLLSGQGPGKQAAGATTSRR